MGRGGIACFGSTSDTTTAGGYATISRSGTLGDVSFSTLGESLFSALGDAPSSSLVDSSACCWMPLPVSCPCFTISALSFAIDSNRSAIFVNASNSSWSFAFPFNAAVSCWAAATIVSSGKTFGCVRY